ncbi:MAG TPA: enoyl-ACP reductase FabV [Polyangia bacterium]|jgi:enoyl-[acyl-carrier protein] reductase/trans-2-enoyl-CoA reductase (NAD+)|nr:enoyl-ACP reductase FabV [Polyangia bacterium]
MSSQVIAARIRGFICLNAHPAGCAANVDAEISIARQGAPGKGLGGALVVGGSTGYGLSSLVSAVFGYGARGTVVCLERPPHGEKTASAGWYNLAAAQQRARAAGREIAVVNGDAFSREIKEQTIAGLQKAGGKLDQVIYSVAAPKRVDGDTSWSSVLKPIGVSFRSKSINLGNDQVTEVEIAPASDAEIEATRRVMGGEDFAAWVRALAEADLLAPGCRAVAYSYVGPALTFPIYRSGTIGKAKEDLEKTTRELSAMLSARVGGAAYVSVNKGLVTQAAAAIPVVPLYISLLYKVMKAAGTHEGTAEQIARLYRDHLAPGQTPRTDAEGRIRIDDLELDPGVQARVAALWAEVNTENLATLSDYAGFRTGFRNLFGFEVPGVDYAAPVETDVAIS